MIGRLSSYGIISLISYLVRSYFLPNPFECFGAKGEIYNMLAEPIIHTVAFFITGLFYEKNTFPAWGSILYFGFYAAVIFTLWLLGLAKFAWWSILLAIVAVAVICIFVYILLHLGEEDYN